MKKIGIAVVLLVFLGMLSSLTALWRSGSLTKRARSVRVGDSKADVRKVLGRPSYVFLPPSGTNFAEWLLSVHSETWAYGTKFDVARALHGEPPFRLRMFRPDTDEVAVVFASSGRVSQVTVPGGAP